MSQLRHKTQLKYVAKFQAGGELKIFVSRKLSIVKIGSLFENDNID